MIAGAGASAVMGYPPWGELVKQLAQEFAPAVTLSDDYLVDVDSIADAAAAADRADEYFKYLDRAFCEDAAKLPISGFIDDSSRSDFAA